MKATHVGASALVPDHLSLVAAAGLGHRPETIQAVRDNEGRRSRVSFGPLVYLMAAEGCHPAKNRSQRMPLVAGLHRSNERHLILRAATDLAAGALPAQACVVDLDPERQGRFRFTLEHRLHELVLEPPTRFVAQPQHPP